MTTEEFIKLMENNPGDPEVIVYTSKSVEIWTKTNNNSHDKERTN